MAGAFIAIGHEPQSEIVDGHRRHRRRRLRRDRGQVHPHQRPRRLRAPATSSTTPTARPSPPPARAARPRSTPSGTCATTRACRPPPRSRAPATWPSSSGRRPRARSGGARRRGPRGLRRRRRRRKDQRPPGGAPDTIEFSTPDFKDGGAIPKELTCDGAGTTADARLAGDARRARSSSCWSSRTRTPRTAPSPTGRRGASPAPPAPAWRPTAQFPAGAQGRQELGRQARLDAALPAQGRRRAPLRRSRSTPWTEGLALEPGASPEDGPAPRSRTPLGRGTFTGTYQRGELADSEGVLALLVARVALRAGSRRSRSACCVPRLRIGHALGLLARRRARVRDARRPRR